MANNFYNDKVGRYEISTVKIEDVDQAVFDYFDKRLSPSVDREDGKPAKVNIIYAAGERWKLIRKNNFRDDNGTLLLPIITIRRSAIDRSRELGGWPQEQKQVVVTKNIHSKTSNLRNLLKARRTINFVEPKQPAVQEYLTIPNPDFLTVFYQVEIWAQYQTQMNEILEKIFHKYSHLDSFIIPMNYEGKEPKGNSYYFVGFREGDLLKLSNEDDFTDSERLIRYQYTIKTPAYLILDPKDDVLSYGKDDEGKNIVYKDQNFVDVKLEENIITLEEFEKLFG